MILQYSSIILYFLHIFLTGATKYLRQTFESFCKNFAGMFRLIILLLLLCLYWKVSHKALCFDRFCFCFMLMIFYTDFIPMCTPFFFADNSNFFTPAVNLPSTTSVGQGLPDKVYDWYWSNGTTKLSNLTSPEEYYYTFQGSYCMSEVGDNHDDLREWFYTGCYYGEISWSVSWLFPFF